MTQPTLFVSPKPTCHKSNDLPRCMLLYRWP